MTTPKKRKRKYSERFWAVWDREHRFLPEVWRKKELAKGSCFQLRKHGADFRVIRVKVEQI